MSLYGRKIASGSFISLCQSAGVLGVSMSTTVIFSVPVALSTYGVIRFYKSYKDE
jgi:ethanolamine transporter EutH